MPVSVLLDELGSKQALNRRFAAEAIVALRDHYVEQAEAVAERGYAGHLSSEAEWYAMSTLGFLRPSQRTIAEGAAEHISFDWDSGVVSSTKKRGSVPSYLLVRGSFAVLPVLANNISASTSFAAGHGRPNDEMQLASATSILGPAVVPWLQSNEKLTHGGGLRDGLDSAIQCLSGDSKSPGVTDWPNFLMQFGNAEALRDRLYTGTLASIKVESYKVKWDLAESLDNNKIVTIDSRTMSLCNYASDRIRNTLALLSFKIGDRTSLDSTHRLPGSNPYPMEAQTDAIRVLGCLRYVDSYYPPWSHLRQLSHTKLLENDVSDETQACLRALGQIDVPAKDFLLTRMYSELAENQQRAATFALGKITGRYSVFYIQNVIEEFQNSAATEKDKDQRARDRTHIARLRAMLKLGQEKKWFQGDFYGVGDPHAYDLIFPKEEGQPSGAPPPAPAQDGKPVAGK